jgi:hypothetical protein
MKRTADQIIAANNAMLASHPDIKNWDDIHAHTIAMRLGKCDICNGGN